MPTVKSLPTALRTASMNMHRGPHAVFQAAAELVLAAGWSAARGTGGPGSSARTAARCRRTRPPGRAPRSCRSTGRPPRCPRAPSPWGSPGTARRAPGSAPRPGRREIVPSHCCPLWLSWAKILAVELVHVVGDLAKARDHLGVEDLDELLVGRVRGVDAHLLGDDQADAALGPLPPVVHVALARAGSPPRSWSGGAGTRGGS